ncbi:undecaprenyl/decaprenyl-phosphate alpha-N-acetylglucosaminyl 1-phosphate transferase [Helicobacter cholecystus]|uniref:Undecaprenyl/decaprenyl-phosphate alpha-N-acetylglucosaminyl 1-phosphate transferase n=1 Tax=Helicobacter cholecystus TaxID=45498 RepID=A0A3D8IWT4_9HELI|nr:MraY family glycosyltransferase [Helicobacter cholecystus]RDU69440.1 undecaprenyl/decaprenyl-phosphate alpha-N-acetylglucosaminyl 1-phosphate transferase [Helicobacter cholecystus]VEJ23989.1 methicillin resistance protein [Helicobacter cholecystus]
MIAFFIFGGLLCSFLLNLFIIWVSRKFGLFVDTATSDKPQRFHSLPTPRAGGIGIFTPFFFTSLSLLYTQSTFLYAILIGGSLVFLSGLIEDFNASLSPKVRLFLQCLGGGVFIYLSDLYLSNLGFGIILPSYIAIPFTIFAIVGMINALNIIDGFNGLAGGIALFGLFFITLLCIGNRELLILLALMGGILGFLLLNFPKGKIFLGDGGAYFLGFILAAFLIQLTQTKDSNISPWFGMGLLIYPFWEVIFSIYRRRFKEKTAAMLPDNHHLHQLLFQKIQSNSKTTFIILSFVLPFMIYAYCFYTHEKMLVLGSATFIFIYLLIYQKLQRSSFH